MEKLGRNDLCHCGSGKKYKSCHMDNETSSRGKNQSFIITGIVVALFAIGLIGYYINAANSNVEAQGQGFTPGPPPSGEAPPGKVWSYEHGHWHDAF